MSVFSDMAGAIRDRLKAYAAFQDVEFIVNEQKVITNQIAQAVAKLSGAVVIFFDGFELVPGVQLTGDARFNLMIYGSPTLKPDGMPVDSLVQAAMPALQGWIPTAGAHCNQAVEVISPADLVPDRVFVIYEFTVRVRVRIPRPDLAPPPPDPEPEPQDPEP
jgi:hypothetical protein